MKDVILTQHHLEKFSLCDTDTDYQGRLWLQTHTTD